MVRGRWGGLDGDEGEESNQSREKNRQSHCEGFMGAIERVMGEKDSRRENSIWAGWDPRFPGYSDLC